VNLVDEESADDSDTEICIAKWVDMPRAISCSFLKPNEAKKDKMRYTFDVLKCDRLFDVLVQGGDKVEGGACDLYHRFDS
jgi:hypothetical protein